LASNGARIVLACTERHNNIAVVDLENGSRQPWAGNENVFWSAGSTACGMNRGPDNLSVEPMTYRRHGTTSLFVALDTKTGKAIEQNAPSSHDYHLSRPRAANAIRADAMPVA